MRPELHRRDSYRAKVERREPPAPGQKSSRLLAAPTRRDRRPVLRPALRASGAAPSGPKDRRRPLREEPNRHRGWRARRAQVLAQAKRGDERRHPEGGQKPTTSHQQRNKNSLPPEDRRAWRDRQRRPDLRPQFASRDRPSFAPQMPVRARHALAEGPGRPRVVDLGPPMRVVDPERTRYGRAWSKRRNSEGRSGWPAAIAQQRKIGRAAGQRKSARRILRKAPRQYTPARLAESSDCGASLFHPTMPARKAQQRARRWREPAS